MARKQGTEYPFTGKYQDRKEHGIYACVCCETDLFLSDTKFDSYIGWPSFYVPASPLNVHTHTDSSEEWCAPKCSAPVSGHTSGMSLMRARL